MAEEEVGLRLTLKDRRETAQGLDDVAGKLDNVGDAADDAGKKAESSGRRFDKLRGALGVIGKGITYTVGALGAMTVAAGAVGIKTAASMEQAKIGFTTMLGSAKQARKFLGDLQTFAAKTPFEFPELQSAASSLVSVGIKTKSVIPIMTTLGNVTAGMGTGAEGIQRATVALQQMTAAQKISGEDLNQLRDAGIPVYDLLSKALGKTKGEVVQLAQSGKLGKDALDKMMKALETGKGLERFNGLMEKQSASLSGVWSTLSDTVNMGLAKAIKPALPMVKDLVLAASGLAQKAMPKLRDGVKAFVGFLQNVIDVYKKGGIKAILAQLTGGASDGASKLGGALNGVGQALTGIDWGKLGGGALSGVVIVLNSFANILQFAADHVDLLAKAIPYLIAAFAAYKAMQAANNAIGKDSLVGFALELAQQLALRKSVKSLAKAFEEMTAAQLAASGAMTASTVAGGAETVTTEANTVAQNANNGATNAGVLASLRQKVATVASTVAQKAAAVASKAWAAAQWLLNAALTANPIGLVIAAIVGLVAIFVLAYAKVGWFRDGVNHAFSAVLGAIRAVWGWVKGNWPTLLAILTGPIGIAVLVIAKNWDRIKSGAGAVKDFVVSKFDSLIGFFTGLPGRISKASSGMWDGIKDAFRSSINWLISKWNGLGFSMPSVDTHIPGVGTIGGWTLGTPDIPLLANGGIVAHRPGGILANIGEGKHDEAVVPMNGRDYLVNRLGVTPLPTAAPPSIDLDDPDFGPGAGSAPIEIHNVIQLDGKVVYESVLNSTRKDLARR